MDSLIVFAKAPVPGRVKTRLVPPLTAEEAARVYRASLADVVAKAEEVEAAIVLSYDPASSAAQYFASEFPAFPRMEQKGADLGERLRQAADDAFASGSERLCIIGGDSPTLPVDYLRQSFAELETADVVFGPTEDGGYYLVGIRSTAWPAAAAVFDDIPWSSPLVLQASLEASGAAGLAVRLAPSWYDVDRPEDLLAAARQAAPGSHLGSLLSGAPGILRRIEPA